MKACVIITILVIGVVIYINGYTILASSRRQGIRALATIGMLLYFSWAFLQIFKILL